MRLLSIDWDYFFPSKEGSNDVEDLAQLLLWDWGHDEAWSSSLNELAWITRAAAFVSHGLPLPRTSGEEDTFWRGVRIAKNAKVFLADSHSKAAAPEVMLGINEVVNYDAHHDGGYGPTVVDMRLKQAVDCSNWMFAYAMESAKLETRYPEWRRAIPDSKPTALHSMTSDYWAEGDEDYDVFHRVFICRSGSWTPPWVDDKFVKFVHSCPNFAKARGVGPFVDLLTPRRWDMKMAEDMAVANAELTKVMLAANA